MSEDPEIEEQEPTGFVQYDVEGVGTVIDPEGEPGYRVRKPDGRVTAFAAVSGNPCQANAAADIAHAIANPPPLPVPAEVTHRQLFLALLDIGLTDAAVRAAVAQIQDATAREAALIELDKSLSVRRDHQLIPFLASAFGLSSAQVDDIFRAAAMR